MLSETRIEPAFIRNGQKMGSVDQKMFKIEMGSFSTGSDNFKIFFSGK